MEVPLIEDQIELRDFDHERIYLVLICQTKYDVIFEEKKEPDMNTLFSKERHDFIELLDNFETKSTID